MLLCAAFAAGSILGWSQKAGKKKKKNHKGAGVCILENALLQLEHSFFFKSRYMTLQNSARWVFFFPHMPQNKPQTFDVCESEPLLDGNHSTASLDVAPRGAPPPLQGPGGRELRDGERGAMGRLKVPHVLAGLGVERERERER